LKKLVFVSNNAKVGEINFYHKETEMKFGHAPNHSRTTYNTSAKRANWSRVGSQHNQRRRLAHQQRCNRELTGGASPRLSTASTGGYNHRANLERNSKQSRSGANGNSNLAITQSPNSNREILNRDNYRSRVYTRQQN